MQELSAQELTFDAIKHEYRLNGVIIPSVTQVLEGSGLYPDFSLINPDALEWKRNLGTQVHAATALDDQDNLGEYDPQIEGYLNAWRRFRRECGFRPVHIEQRTFHKKYLYAGTLDRIGVMDGKNVLVDIKTGVVDLMAVGPQTAAYCEAWGLHTKGRYAVKLNDEGTYKLSHCNDRMDFSIFLNCLNLWRWKENHK